ncbi:TrbG/VirB9 family P-type conjugative transfer protein [Caulobacter radicis]|uniref:TrbG/VirB9 family P-type conjugative transfer protein n=1 Tax=Caulobacter radicis TaxID=2172650 RepID=UPI001401E0C8|nr:TrbG/VirB9 family P-type conjugative transfer protein [Caulobacter radicis]
MKRPLLALSLACLLATPVLAQTSPAQTSLAQTSLAHTSPAQPAAAPASAPDPRIRTLPYDPDQVYRLSGVMGFQTMLEFAPDERIENVSIGDAVGWQVTPNKRANLLFLKPMDRAPATNMTVVTDRRRYVFELSVSPGGGPADASYVLRFRYPPAPVVAPVPTAEPAAPPPARNTAYSVRGSRAVTPSGVFDDGRATYFAWTGQTELPAIFVIGADGSEGLANAVVKDGHLVVDQVAPRFVLRSDKARATVVNRAWRKIQAPEKAG